MLITTPPHFDTLLFFFTDTATTKIYTLSLHDALPISRNSARRALLQRAPGEGERQQIRVAAARSEEHTSELQSHSDLVCRLLLEKKKKKQRHQQGQRIPPAPGSPCRPWLRPPSSSAAA